MWKIKKKYFRATFEIILFFNHFEYFLVRLSPNAFMKVCVPIKKLFQFSAHTVHSYLEHRLTDKQATIQKPFYFASQGMYDSKLDQRSMFDNIGSGTHIAQLQPLGPKIWHGKFYQLTRKLALGVEVFGAVVRCLTGNW